MNSEFVIGVDVGTGSVRAGIFTLKGKMIAFAQRGITVWRPATDFVEQSSENIWRAASESVKEAVREAHIKPEQIVGMAFDATCSLVALDAKNRPVTVSPGGNSQQNIIVWMDHRAIEQAERINKRKFAVLNFVGGKISPEMEIPKLMWVKENLPKTWNSATLFLDLADYMGYRATGIDIRSLCTTVCKWTYLGKEERWDKNFFKTMGVDDLLLSNKIGTRILPMGTTMGTLTAESAKQFGLTTKTSVAVGIIDAHAGGLGVLGSSFDEVPPLKEFERVLALIGGTSSCHMAVSRKPLFVPGVWGPYYSAMIPGMWLSEGGQSATGSLLDFIIRDTAAFPAIQKEANDRKLTTYQILNNLVGVIKNREKKGPEIAKDLHVLPYFLGNRSPNADPRARGVISGLTLDDSVEHAALKYYATIQAIAYGTRHIIEAMNEEGYHINRIHACGGGTKNPLWLQEHADITGCEIILSKEPEAVILGSAMLAAVGAGKYRSVVEASVQMSAPGERYTPQRETRSFREKKYKVFREMYCDLKKYQAMMGKK